MFLKSTPISEFASKMSGASEKDFVNSGLNYTIEGNSTADRILSYCLNSRFPIDVDKPKLSGTRLLDLTRLTCKSKITIGLDLGFFAFLHLPLLRLS